MERDVEEIIRDVENSLTKRQRAVFEIVKNAKVDVNVRYIAKKLNLSEYTIRNFTRTLTKLGYLKESYVGKAGIMKMYSLPSDDEIKKIKKKVRKKYDTFNFPEIKTNKKDMVLSVKFWFDSAYEDGNELGMLSCIDFLKNFVDYVLKSEGLHYGYGHQTISVMENAYEEFSLRRVDRLVEKKYRPAEIYL